MELDEYFQTIFETPIETKEFLEYMAKAAMDDKATKSLEFALRLLDAHTDVPEIAKIVDAIKAAMGGAGAGAGDKGYPAPGSPGYGTPGSAGKEDKGGKKTVKKEDLKKEEEDPDKLLIKVDDPAAQAQLEKFWMEKEEQGKMLKQANDEIAALKRTERLHGMMAKAAEFDTLPQDGLAEHLMSIEDIGTETLEKEIAILEMANEANKRSKVMEEVGSSHVPTGILSDIDKGAKGIMAKSKDMTEAAARLAYVKAHPDAYEKYDQERFGHKGA